MSFLPFNGGRHVCFGKTFVEVMLKIISSMMAQKFDIEFVDKEKYYGPANLPKISLN